MATEAQWRERIVEEARSWILTPYHHEGRVKGIDGGVDCAMLLAEVYERCGLIPHITIDHYSPDWYMHRSEERYLGMIMSFAVSIEGDPKPGDVEVFQLGRCVSHAAIITSYPMVVHAFRPFGCVYEDNIQSNRELRGRSKGFYRYREWV